MCVLVAPTGFGPRSLEMEAASDLQAVDANLREFLSPVCH